jgi:hypothetical protein
MAPSGSYSEAHRIIRRGFLKKQPVTDVRFGRRRAGVSGEFPCQRQIEMSPFERAAQEGMLG